LPAIHTRQADITDQQVDALGRIEYRFDAVTITSLDEAGEKGAKARLRMLCGMPQPVSMALSTA